jgi:carbonic anhydrase
MIPAKEAQQKLIEGNNRYVSGKNSLHTHKSDLVDGQKPFAVILGCSDSRVAPEIIFDQGAGELFVVRVAGNVVESSQLGSIEYAVEHLGVKLVVVLGHADCGAVTATVNELKNRSDNISHGIETVMQSIKPSAIKADLDINLAITENVKAQVKKLSFGSDCVVIGAEFCLETGIVNFI